MDHHPGRKENRELGLTVRSRSSGVRAFTLIEVLLVLALIGVLIGLVAVNAGAFVEASKYEPPARVLGKAVMDSFYFASESKRTTYLSYWEENATFLVSDGTGKVLANHGIFEKEDLDELREEDLLPRVIFRATGPLAGLSGGDSLHEDDLLVIGRVPFHFGTSMPFQAEIEIEGEEEVEIIEFDPFSGYPVAKEE